MQRILQSAPDDELPHLEAGLRQFYLPDFKIWSEYFFQNYLTAPCSQLHLRLIELQQDQHLRRGKKTAIVAPRLGAKTTWTTKLYSLYQVCHGLEPYSLLVSATEGQTKKNIAAIQDQLETNQLLARYYPDVCGKGPTWNKTEIETRNGFRIEGMGAGSSRRGATFGEFRPSLIIIDDLIEDDAARSEIQRDNMSSWLLQSLLPMGDASLNVIFVGTAMHADDPLQRLRKMAGLRFESYRSLLSEPKNDKLWEQWRGIFSDPFDQNRDVKARAFFEINKTAMLEGAEALWPERESVYDLMVYRNTAGEVSFQAEKQSDPSASSKAEWPADLFGPKIWFDRFPALLCKVIALDPSKGKSDTSDYSAFVLAGYAEDGCIYVDADIERRDTTRIVSDGLVLNHFFKPDLLSIEVNQFQELLKDEFDRQAMAMGIPIPLAAITNTMHKETRIRLLGPYLRNGKLRFRSNSTGAARLVKQLQEFPRASHDDGPDALEMAISTLKHLLYSSKQTPMQEVWSA